MDKLSSENKFAIMPEWVIELNISHTAFRLYAILARYADNVTHQAFPSLDTLAERLGCSEKTVRRAIDDLIEHGAITKHNRGRYQSNLYTVMTSSPNGTSVSLEGTKMSQRVDMDDQVTITIELDPEELYKETKSAKATQLPPNWEPQALTDFANKYPDLTYEETFEAFKDFHLAKGSTFKDWDAAFRTWCRNAVKFQKPRTVIHKQELKPAAQGPGYRDWVKGLHDIGEHYECRPGEFGCK